MLKISKVFITVLLTVLFMGCGGGSSNPSAPTIAVTSGPNENTITWEAVSGVDSYNLYYYIDGKTMMKEDASGVTKVENVTSPYVHSGLVNNTTYVYYMTSVKGTKEGDASLAVNGTPEFVGVLDTSFAEGVGYVKMDGVLGAYMEVEEGLDGNMFALNGGENGNYLYKFDVNGNLDASFGEDGKIANDICRMMSFDLDSLDNIYISGVCVNTIDGCAEQACFRIWKYNSSGDLDTGFGDSGVVRINDKASYANDITCATDGTCFVAGIIDGYGCTVEHCATIWKFDSNGSLVTDFNSTGYFQYNTPVKSFLNALSLDSDGNVLSVGVYNTPDLTNNTRFIMKLKSDGTLNENFAGNGFNVIEGLGSLQQIIIDPDNNLYVGGYEYNNSTAKVTPILIKYSSNGTKTQLLQIMEFLILI